MRGFFVHHLPLKTFLLYPYFSPAQSIKHHLQQLPKLSGQISAALVFDELDQTFPVIEIYPQLPYLEPLSHIVKTQNSHRPSSIQYSEFWRWRNVLTSSFEHPFGSKITQTFARAPLYTIQSVTRINEPAYYIHFFAILNVWGAWNPRCRWRTLRLPIFSFLLFYEWTFGDFAPVLIN
jgi:hypothetical protein